MRENRTHGSEGGEDGVLSYPYHEAKRIARLIATTRARPAQAP